MTNIDYGMLLEKFLDILPPEEQHKSFVKKILNRTNRFHKRNGRLAAMAEARVNVAVKKAEDVYRENNHTISIGAVCWVIFNKHQDELKEYNLSRVWFEQMNRYYSAQGVIMSSAKVVTTIEGFIDEQA